MVGYVCESCPLAFEVGYYGYWDLSGGCVKYVCSACGTMHKMDYRQNQPDLLYAIDGPIRAMVEESHQLFNGETSTDLRLPITEESWRLIGPLPTTDHSPEGWCARAQAISLDTLACAHCHHIGGLVSRYWPLGADGKWPSFGENCPVCRGNLQEVYLHTIN